MFRDMALSNTASVYDEKAEINRRNSSNQNFVKLTVINVKGQCRAM
jgi:hypothetical protein